jgi:hypothetical protein
MADQWVRISEMGKKNASGVVDTAGGTHSISSGVACGGGPLVAQDFAGEREEVDADWEKSRSKVQSPQVQFDRYTAPTHTHHGYQINN